MKHPRAIWIALLAIVAIARSAGAASVDWSEAFVLLGLGVAACAAPRGRSARR